VTAARRLHPFPWQADYIQLRALRIQIASRLVARFPDTHRLSVLDVGCSDRPYEPLLACYQTRYVGLDTNPGERVDVVGDAEALPFNDASFDCILCTQVLQYTRRPERAVAELRRVLRPGGMLFLSTHGVAFEDRDGGDRWRFTRFGLHTLMERAGTWDTIEVLPAGGVTCAANYLISGQLQSAAHRAGIPWLIAPLVLVLNSLAWNCDRVTRLLFPELPPDISVNYLAVGYAD
jgi:SAM-dependent methyltransferase